MEDKKLLVEDYVKNITDESCKNFLHNPFMDNDNSDYKNTMTKIIFILKKTENEIKNNIDKNFDLNLISYEEKEVFEYLRHNKVENFFVFNNSVDENKTKINNLNDISILFSINDYIAENMEISFNKSKFFINKLNSNIKNLIETSNGILIYQEDFIQITRKLTGWDFDKCNNFRRELGKKNAEKLNLLKLEFIDSLITNRFDEIISKEVFELLCYFADKLINKSFAILNATLLYQWNYLCIYYSEIIDNLKATYKIFL